MNKKMNKNKKMCQVFSCIKNNKVNMNYKILNHLYQITNKIKLN